MTNLLQTVVDVLRASGDAVRGRAVAEYLDRDDSWAATDGPTATTATYAVAHFLVDHFARTDPARAWGVVRRVVPHLRWFLRDRTAGERVRAAAQCDALRFRVVRLCYDQDADDPNPTDESLALTLVWDTILGQQLLSERLAAAGRSSGDWPGSDLVRASLPPAATARPFVQAPRPPAVLGRRAGHGAAAAAAPPGVAAAVDSATAAARERLRDLAIDETRLAGILGPRRALLRAGFAGDGRLVWALYQTAGERLVVRGRGVSAAGVDARRAIAEAVAAHEEAICEAWDRYRLSQAWDEVPLRRGLAAVEGLFAAGQPEGLLGAVRRLAEELARKGLDRYRRRLAARFPGVDASGVDPAAWRAFWAGVAAEALPADRLEPHLDRATARLLDSVARVWDVGAVAAALAAAGRPDLLLQTDGVLHAVPVAFLSHDGRHLFESVPACHAIYSLGVDEWLAELDQEEFRAAAAAPDRVLSVSWFRGRDPARECVAELHGGHAALAASRPGREAYAAVDPSRTHATLARGLANRGPFRVVSVCGHGADEGRGIELGDGVWTGDAVHVPYADSPPGETWVRSFPACDLHGVELLVQVSCSVGRVRQPDGEDADGVSLDLAVRGGRAVAAGRWPLHAGHAVAFANALAGEYLKARGAVRAGPGENLADALVRAAPRARAVAAVRADWLRESRAGTAAFGLNTVAAFELYGRG